MPDSWFVYIAETRTERFYTGISTDPQRRIADHNRGMGARLAQDQGVFALRYVSPHDGVLNKEDLTDIFTAAERETHPNWRWIT